MKQIISIKFLAKWQEVTGNHTMYRKDTVEFVLGNGPCGLCVTRLDMQVAGDTIHIGQECSDGTFKEFIYKKVDIIGRIEVTAIETERQGAAN